MENLVTPASNNRVTIAATAGEWHVSVHQDGKKAIVNYAATRSELAKKMGLGRKSKAKPRKKTRGK